MQVRHPQYGVGEVKTLTEFTADISFYGARRTIAPASSELTPAVPTAAVSGLQVPLSNFIRETAHVIVEALGLEEKVNASDKLTDADEVDLKQYTTRCYGSLTTFNILFKNKEDQFSSGS